MKIKHMECFGPTMVEEWGLEEVVKDQIAGMTDRYAVNMFSEIFIPKGWR